MSPIVSVIIPAYNRAGSILAAIESALAQTMTSIEVIVVDDGSDDETVEVVRSVQDERVRLIPRKHNGGAAAARNAGIAAAQADFVALLDSDDTWRPEKLERQLAAFAARPEVTAAICGVHMRLLDHGRAYDFIPEPTDDWLRRLLADCGVNPGVTLLARRSLFASVGAMDETLARFEDWDWLIRHAAAGGALHIVPEVLATVNNRRGRLARETEQAARSFLAKHAQLRAGYGQRFARRAASDVWMQAAGTYAFAGDWLGFARVYGRAFALNPVSCTGRLLRAGWGQLTRRGPARGIAA